MHPVDPERHSFIIKVWLEEAVPGQQLVPWRGSITHVPSGERRYLQNLNDMLDFIKPYLVEMGADVNSGRLGGQTWWARLRQSVGKRRH